MYTMPLGPLQSKLLEQPLGIPEGTIQGVHVGSIPFIKYMGMVYGAYSVTPTARPMMKWVDDTIAVLAKG